MKGIKKGLALLLLVSLILVSPVNPAHAIQDKVVTFTDATLNQVIHEALGIPLSQEIHQSDLETLATLDAIDSGNIRDISGLQYCTNLVWLELSQNGGLSDISPLAKLTKLQHLGLFFTGISDLRPLRNLTNLQYLSVAVAEVTDIRPLSRLVNLQTLYLGNNFITDIKPLVENDGLGAGDRIVLTNNPLDTTPSSKTMQYIETLIDRGATVLYPPYPNPYP